MSEEKKVPWTKNYICSDCTNTYNCTRHKFRMEIYEKKYLEKHSMTPKQVCPDYAPEMVEKAVADAYDAMLKKLVISTTDMLSSISEELVEIATDMRKECGAHEDWACRNDNKLIEISESINILIEKVTIEVEKLNIN